ncbi:type VI secretion system protein TssA [Zavarzinella formosa]|uniref:type VI secretion system protein TssA n=1 Tax=Zavarzinella formosa TaxID=360055 RepID=UPI00030C93D8|nr:type VI secretion system protein TssA [Zavarzinella formosa]
MPREPYLEIDALLQPIPGGEPAGQPASVVLRQQLDIARKEDPFDPSVKADWPMVRRLAEEALQNTGKDLLVATRLAEAATRLHGFGGLREGLTLLRRFWNEWWDTFHPVPETPEDLDLRTGPLNWMNDATRAARFPASLGRLPMIRIKKTAYSLHDWQDAETASRLAIEGANRRDVEIDDFRQNYADLLEAERELVELSKAVDEKIAQADLSLLAGGSTLGAAVAECKTMMEGISKKLNIPLAEETHAPAAPTATASAGGTAPAPVFHAQPAGMSRDDLYRQLSQIADALQALEPHSPIPLMIRRAVRLGGLSFPELMREIIRQNSGANDELDQLLGVVRE